MCGDHNKRLGKREIPGGLFLNVYLFYYFYLCVRMSVCYVFNFTIFIYMYVYVWVCVMYGCPQMPKMGIQSSGPGARDDCKPLDMSARNHTWVFSQILGFTPALGLLCDAKQRPTESARESRWQLSSIRSVPNVQLANLSSWSWPPGCYPYPNVTSPAP